MNERLSFVLCNNLELTEITGITISYLPSDWEDYSTRVTEHILTKSVAVVVAVVVLLF